MHAELKKKNIHVTTVVPNLMRTGSPRNVTVKGDHEKEYAWFKVSDSSPLLSQDIRNAAKSIIHALEYGEAEAILTSTAKLATLVKGVAPGWVSNLLAITNRFLPSSIEGGNESKKGYQAESKRSRGPTAALSDRAAIRNNEL
jgi:short-subunit dehydrogenase